MNALEARYSPLHNLSMSVVAIGVAGAAVLHFATNSQNAPTLSLNDPRFVMFALLSIAMAFYGWLGVTRFLNRRPPVVIDGDGITLLSIAGAVAFATWGPLASKPLPTSMVLSLDLRKVPPESATADLLSGGLWRGSRDITETLELLWQAADDPRVVGLYVDIGDE